MTKHLVAGLPALALAALTLAAPAPASALNLLGAVSGALGNAVGSNVSDPRDKPEVQAEQEFYDRQAREESDHTNQAAQAEQDYYDDQSRAEREYYGSFDR